MGVCACFIHLAGITGRPPLSLRIVLLGPAPLPHLPQSDPVPSQNISRVAPGCLRSNIYSCILGYFRFIFVETLSCSSDVGPELAVDEAEDEGKQASDGRSFGCGSQGGAQLGDEPKKGKKQHHAGIAHHSSRIRAAGGSVACSGQLCDEVQKK